MNYTPKVRQKKSNFWGVFIMKLTYDDKVQIYELRKQGYSLEKLSNKFGINNSNIRYMIKLIDRYGIEFVKKGKNRYYSPDLKQEMINQVLHEGWTKDRVSLEYGLPSRTILLNWLAQYRKNGYTIVEKTRGRVPESGECHPKKVKRTPIEGGKRERRKTEIVQELMTEFSLDLLLKAIKLARSTYYYHLKQLDKTDKDQELKAEIQSIFIEHKGNYGYRRIYLELRNRGYLVNHKRVQGLMKVLNLQAKMRQKRKYSSHKGDVGKKAENLIQGQFEGSKTMEKCYTDVTEFAIPASTQKLYLSPVLDGFNSEIIAYNLSCSLNLEQVQTMLEQAFTEKHYGGVLLWDSEIGNVLWL
ncbi:hypothetical protein PC0116_04480 [Streptococcus pneumoniae]|nr:transposase InsK for insertion sequence [Streptococcus pneumoniae]VSE74195.1 transposase InsK for insertion sequence [Streptococcus pneumoniae]VSE94840.1 transposase InsK for insertion sequence [Streptococcus pneumoniae]VTE90546.1 transposase InsK for insertion sequence [Streptococcus pneumoniae]VTE94983.1 transposase InsK for insertion sequence [Streptococcus pneumoniae]